MNAAPLKVFVVDDDLDTTECMRLLLKHWGHEVHVSNRGREAIEQAPFVQPDLMLVDLGMPDVDGLTVARELSHRSTLASTSLVALTGYADQQHRQQALDAGFHECLVKPLPADAMLKLLSRVASRIAEARERLTRTTQAVAASREIHAETRRHLESPIAWQPITQQPSAGETSPDVAPIFIRVQKSGISDLILLENQNMAGDLRQWLRERGCRVGPVFEPSAGQFAFFTYSRRQAHLLLASHPRVRVQA